MGVYLTRLPSEYQEVEYIDGPGSADGLSGPYIDTGYKANNNTRFLIDYQPLGVGAGPIGSYNNPSGVGFIINCRGSSYEILPHYNTGDSGTGYTYSTRITADFNKNNFYINGDLKKTFTAATFQMNINTWLFGWNRNGVQSNCRSMRLYNAKIYDNGTLVRDFVPCYRKSDNVIGLYDVVNNQFYTNSGTGAFSKGADVTAFPLKNAYIGEYIPESGLLGYRPLQSDLKDYSGNGKDGSWYSGTGSFGTVGGKVGAVVTKISHVGYDDHDTTKQHIVTTLNYSGPTVTICGRVYYNSMNSGLWNGILTNTSSNSNFISLSPRPAQSNKWTVGGGGNLLTANTTATTGTWYFACGVLSSSGKRVYLNGSLIGSDSTGFTTGQGSIWRLGCGQINSGTNMATAGGTAGYIRHCAVYNRELTADEILRYYNLTA